MPKLKVIKAFDWAHRHVDVQSYAKGDVIDTEDEDLIRVAKEEKWVTDASNADVKGQIKAVEAEISALKSKLTAANEAAKPAIEKELQAKAAELAALQA